MHIYPMARGTGKTTCICDEVNWCILLDIAPVCIIAPKGRMCAQFHDYLAHNLTNEEYLNILVIHAGMDAHAPDGISNILRSFREINPKRIYIDEVQSLTKDFMDELQSIYDDIIYAYGTPRTGNDINYGERYWDFK